MTIIPSGVTKIFPNIQTLIFDGTGFQSLTARDLAQFGSKLQNLRIEGEFDNRNPISVLPSDVFSFTPNLERIRFDFNHLQYVGPNIFKGLNSLEFCDFFLNDCINYIGRTQDQCQTLNDYLPQKCNNITALQASIDQLRNASQASVQSQLQLLITMVIASIVIGGLSYWRIDSRDQNQCFNQLKWRLWRASNTFDALLFESSASSSFERLLTPITSYVFSFRDFVLPTSFSGFQK